VLKYATVGCALLCWEGTERPVPLFYFYINNRKGYNHGFGFCRYPVQGFHIISRMELGKLYRICLVRLCISHREQIAICKSGSGQRGHVARKMRNRPICSRL
jgi:hypothetical protein